MHLRVLDGNPWVKKQRSSAKLKVKRRNNQLVEGLWLELSLRIRLQPPVFDITPVTSDAELIETVRLTYDDMPHSLRTKEPFEGVFQVVKTGRAGPMFAEHTMSRSYVHLHLMRTMAYYRCRSDFYEAVRGLELLVMAFAKPWQLLEWRAQMVIRLKMQYGRTCPPWLAEFCAKWNIRLEAADGWPVEAYV